MKLFKNVVLTIIAGVGYGVLSEEGAKLCEINTPYGPVSVSVLQAGDNFDIAFISRHQGKRHVPPHQINFRALVDAARQIGVPVLSVNSVGLMREVPLAGNFETDSVLKNKTHAAPNSFLDFPFFIPNDFIDMTQNRVGTFHNDETVHVDMTDPYCADLRNKLYQILESQSISYSEGIYLCTEGPRFETKAEIQMFAHFADVVGMTGVPEVILAKEAGLCYASLCVITNPAAGLSQNMVTADEVKVGVEKNQKTVIEIIAALSSVLSNQKEDDCKKSCRCQSATVSAKL
ncbi:MTAP family purine nucleoside phosphorylase [Methanimicrococcus blatticola]|uniref:Probable S-methyl-5'-thioinosine phosphorylase n=1 Tax=Methanimicrococcus blatticola TaxID=91560 RepID=A0A484F7Y7_9EURY|nr:MTAP family purine nucleoside phosphorylase [Methanimicrococcus blatticola]MBZ3934966.1 MTAP family purine nucleoside phosphorylase [Methanimicrococcus blatticola]MCC2508935.1 MTAP family purine nucleoside phosphorylase [Methanimicrococcus blatticola]TDQ71036.1 methylthioadenosine phosphorylase [Methanimicrococcus blatticola]